MTNVQRTLIVCSASEDAASNLIKALNIRGMLVPDSQPLKAQLESNFGAPADTPLTYFVVDGPSSVEVSVAVTEELKESLSFVYCSNSERIQTDFEKLGLSFVPERTLCMIKPDAASKAREILDYLRKHGFTIIRMKKMHMTQSAAKEFYVEHSGREFYDPLTAFIASGPLFAVVLERVGAIKAYRQLLGPTNSHKAKEQQTNSIRALFGTDGRRNACHGSDSPESADREINFFFPELKIQCRGDFETFVKGLMSAGMVDGGQSNGKGAPNSSLSEVLVQGLKATFTAKPKDPVEFLGRWLVNAAPSSVKRASNQPIPVVKMPN